ARALAREPAAVAAQFDRRVRLAGQWINDKTVFLDNRQMQGRVGFFVVTPLRLDRSPDVVLVERGWVARNFVDRNSLPAVVTPAGEVEVDGRVAATPSRLFQFADAASGVIRQNIDPRAYARETGLPLLPLSIVETPTAANAHDGLTRIWSAPAVDVQMNYGYAFQWFAIGAVIVFLYVRFALLRPRRRRDD
ncbi:MAG TPA: SURF1 family protein, partial [Caldimonas sp.]|nr:SURF1 family protein [Caldimonas sp.]